MLAVLNRMPPPLPALLALRCAALRNKGRTVRLTGRRPSSTIARSFSAELEDIFRIENSVADLDAKLDERCVTQPTS